MQVCPMAIPGAYALQPPPITAGSLAQGQLDGRMDKDAFDPIIGRGQTQQCQLLVGEGAAYLVVASVDHVIGLGGRQL